MATTRGIARSCQSQNFSASYRELQEKEANNLVRVLALGLDRMSGLDTPNTELEGRASATLRL
jgi:hypothetical protein